MYFIIQANGINNHIEVPKIEDVAMTRIQMAMEEEGDATIKAYLTDFADYLAELEEESGGEQASRDPKDWVNYIADNLVTNNTTIYLVVKGEPKQLGYDDRRTIASYIEDIFNKTLEVSVA